MLEPLPLTLVDRRGSQELLLRAVLVGDLDGDVLSWLEVLQVEDRDLVSSGDLVVVCAVLEPEGEHTGC